MQDLNKFTIQKSFAIDAGAGSGKTYTLSRRYINALLGFDYFREDYATQESYFDDHKTKSAEVNQIVTLTYTEAAALEMKGRIFELISKIINYDNLWLIELEKRKKLDYKKDGDFDSIEEVNSTLSQEEQNYVNDRLQKAYQNSSDSKISTIHSFCLNIIKSNSDIARIDTKLDMIKDDEKQKLLSNIIFETLNDKNNEALVMGISADIGMYFINNLINRYVSNSKFRNDYDSFDKNSISLLDYKKVMFELYPFKTMKDSIEFIKSYMIINQFEHQDQYTNFLDKYISNFEEFNPIKWTALSKEYTKKITFISNPWKKFKEDEELRIHIETIKKLDDLVDIYSQIDTQKEQLFFDKIASIKNLLHQIKAKYDQELKNLNKIDFDTIITKTLEIMPKIDTNYKYIMVDEFQDTNQTQFQIVKDAKADNIFVVGDSKQSIYSFQGAEIEVFNNAILDKELFYSVEPMKDNRRSDQVILDTVNKIFDELLNPNENLKLISANFEATAQSLDPATKEQKNKGSFDYLITSQAYKEETNELDTIANFISEIKEGKNTKYKHITKLINDKDKAVAIVFDSSTKMLELKQKLKQKGITAKVSASDNFYYTKEVNDIFNVLKAIDILSRKKEKLSSSQRYYVVGALRSNILRCDDNSIKRYLDTNTLPDQLLKYIDIFDTLPLSQAVKFIYDDSNIMGVYTHFDDVEQRAANLNKFLSLCLEYENSDESNLYKFLSLIENSIYFSEAKEDEAFFKSDNAKSVEICSIHSTKGLAYPLVLLGNSDKGLYGQIQSDALKHNNFTLNNEKKEIVGFKIGDYTPLSHRVLKQVDKLKHLAEKKRLLYVALTRAEHDVVISAQLKQKSSGDISLREDSYLHMIKDALNIDVDELYKQGLKNIQSEEVDTENVITKSIEYIEHSLSKINFESKNLMSATNNDSSDKEIITLDNDTAKLGTITHEIIEYYWNSFKDNSEALLDKNMIFDPLQRERIIKNMNSFYKSEIYELLKNGVDHHFELEFNHEGKTGFIDFIYFDKEKNGWFIVDFKTGLETDEKNDKYQKQLGFYQEVMEHLDYEIVDTRLLWLSEH